MGRQMSKLVTLSLQRVAELGQNAFTAYEDCMRYRKNAALPELQSLV